jgi:hypothetical protein
MRTYTRLGLEATLAALLEAVERARAEGTKPPRRSKYDRPWVQDGITVGHWYRKLRQGKAYDPRYAPGAARRWSRLPRRAANGAAATH